MERDLPVGRYTTQTGTWGPHMAGTCPESHSSTESPACSHAQTMCTRVKGKYHRDSLFLDCALSIAKHCYSTKHKDT